MSEKNKKNVMGPLLYRSFASFLYYSNLLKAYRQVQVSGGDTPWRILRYKRIVNPESLGYPVHKLGYVRPATFEMQMKLLSEKCHVISLSTLLQSIEQKTTLSKDTIVLTFDCGFLEHYELALPTLEKYSLKATFFLPTSFIGTNNLFWQDKVALGLLLLKQDNQDYPTFSFFDEEFYTILDKLSPDGISYPGIAYYIETIRSLPIEQRQICLSILGQSVDELGGLTVGRTFMNWNEVVHLVSLGHSVASMGSGHIPMAQYDKTVILRDLGDAAHMLRRTGFPFIPAIALPEDSLSAETLSVFGESGVRYVLSPLPMSNPESYKLSTVPLGRVPVFEGQSFCKEIFACHTWNVSLLGVSY